MPFLFSSILSEWQLLIFPIKTLLKITHICSTSKLTFIRFSASSNLAFAASSFFFFFACARKIDHSTRTSQFENNLSRNKLHLKAFKVTLCIKNTFQAIFWITRLFMQEVRNSWVFPRFGFKLGFLISILFFFFFFKMKYLRTEIFDLTPLNVCR